MGHVTSLPPVTPCCPQGEAACALRGRALWEPGTAASWDTGGPQAQGAAQERAGGGWRAGGLQVYSIKQEKVQKSVQ